MLRADSDKFPGMYVTRLLELAVKIGAVPLSAFGVLLEMPDIRDMVKKFPELLDVALKHRIEGFASLNYANAEKKHKAIQHALTFNLTADGKHIPLLAASNDYFHEPHAIVLRGWNDKDKTYKIQNSWGEEWGDGGYKYVPRDAIDGAYAIYPNKIALPFSDVTEKDWFFKDLPRFVFIIKTILHIPSGKSKYTIPSESPSVISIISLYLSVFGICFSAETLTISSSSHSSQHSAIAEPSFIGPGTSMCCSHIPNA